MSQTELKSAPMMVNRPEERLNKRGGEKGKEKEGRERENFLLVLLIKAERLCGTRVAVTKWFGVEVRGLSTEKCKLAIYILNCQGRCDLMIACHSTPNNHRSRR